MKGAFDGSVPHLNLVFAWAWILAGLLSGSILGLGFHREDWLGGYSSRTRRLFRLGHISFFGLGLLNLAYFLSVQAVGAGGGTVAWAGWAFIVGGLTMPCCCVLMGIGRAGRACFALPVGSLLVAAVAALWSFL